MKVYNGEEKILGRLATQVAKDILDGEEVRLVNAEKVFIVGNKGMILSKYRKNRERGKQMRGPFYPRRPERIFTRTVRGMLPYQKPRGRRALKRFRAYIGVPSEFQDSKIIVPDVKDAEGSKGVTLGEVSSYLGAKF
ncbi:MAG: 50S ribosomal protein L13 [Thermoplasmata archaeon]